MVGDRSHDVVGAKANGVRPIGVLWGYGSRDELIAAGAAVLCDEPASLRRALRFGKGMNAFSIMPVAMEHIDGKVVLLRTWRQHAES